MTGNKLDRVLDFFPARDWNPVYWSLLIYAAMLPAAGAALYFTAIGEVFAGLSLFFISLILVSYQYPGNGVAFAVVISLFHIITVLWFHHDIISLHNVDITTRTLLTGTSMPGLVPESEIRALIIAVVQSVIFIMVGAVVSALSMGLKRQEQRYYNTFHREDAGVIVLDPEKMTIEELNPSAAGILGYHHENLIGMKLSSFWRDVDTDGFLRSLRENGTIDSCEARFFCKLDREIQVHLSDAHLPREGIALIMVDITEQKAAEEALHESQRAIATLMSNIPGMAYNYTRQGNQWWIEFVSDGVLPLTGYNAEEMIAMPMSRYQEIVHQEDRERWRDEISCALEEERPYRHTYRIYTAANEERWIWEQGRGVHPGQDGYAGIEGFATDITSEVRSREQITVACDEANLYLDIMSHDINNTNTVALGYLEFVKDMLDGTAKEMVQKAYEGVGKSHSIIRNVSTIRTINENQDRLRPVSLDAVIKTELQVFAHSNLHYGPSGLEVMANDLLPEVFTNLIGNSIKHGGDDVNITISAEDVGSNVIITVADDGPGIPDRLKRTMFSRFQRGQTAVAGLGLGLFITKKLLDQYRGSIQAEDRIPGDITGGALIRISLIKAPGR